MIFGHAAAEPSPSVAVATPIVSPNGDGPLDRLRFSVDAEPSGVLPDTVEVTGRLHTKDGALATGWHAWVVPGIPLPVGSRLDAADGSYELDAAAPECPPAPPTEHGVAQACEVVADRIRDEVCGHAREPQPRRSSAIGRVARSRKAGSEPVIARPTAASRCQTRNGLTRAPGGIMPRASLMAA